MNNEVWRKFFGVRDASVWERFSGLYRAHVVETNDPLNMGRLKFRCPDLHNSDLEIEDCQWAVPAYDSGSKGSGRWTAPCIGDVIWIGFERSHPFGPVWIGAATPTRRRYHQLPSVHQRTPPSIDNVASIDYSPDYLPLDGRPMSTGWSDRYGNVDLSSAVGFFPVEHATAPRADFDAMQGANFAQAIVAPGINVPDAKCMARISKYGNISMLCDQGYWWKKDGDFGEFSGSFDDDAGFEAARWLYLQRVLNEDVPTGGDQRGTLSLTRYGNRIEQRDTGWAQIGPQPSKSRAGEYGDPTFLSKEEINDFRWTKIRTKGGWLIQAYDKGYDPQNDEYIKRQIIDELGSGSEREDVHWANKDARWLRIMGRHVKFVIDERGTDHALAATNETPRANGVLIKGRRTPGCRIDGAIAGDPRGFYFEFNENDETNHMTFGSPLGQVIELNDATEYLMICAGLGGDYAMPWRGLEENEFLRQPTRSRLPERNAHHLVLDHENEYIRLKSRSGHGNAARSVVNASGLDIDSVNQGLEIHDGSLGDGPWVEMVDADDRGFWLSKKLGIGVWRGKQGTDLHILINDNANQLVLHNGAVGGTLQLNCVGAIQIISSGDINLQGTNVNIKATNKIRLEAGGTPTTYSVGKIDTQAAQDVGGEAVVFTPTIAAPASVKPADRGIWHNAPSSATDAQIEHPI